MRINTVRFTVILLIVFDFAIAAMLVAQPVPLKIGLSKASPNYINWLKKSCPEALAVDLYSLPVESAIRTLSECSGLVLTGGEDVWPGRYGRTADTIRCTEMNPHRDSLDIALITKALALKMPVVGICRGHQILNVALGGSLIIDIPADIGRQVIHQCDDYLSCFHMVTIKQGTLLAQVCQCDSAMVTTNHHQAVDRFSTELTGNAIAADQLTEGLEWRDPTGKSFLLGVQWHPERMENGNPLSTRIADEFIRQSKMYSTKH